MKNNFKYSKGTSVNTTDGIGVIEEISTMPFPYYVKLQNGYAWQNDSHIISVIKYYNTQTSLGVIGIPADNIKHTDGDYTFVFFGTKSEWIKTNELCATYDEAKILHND